MHTLLDFDGNQPADVLINAVSANPLMKKNLRPLTIYRGGCYFKTTLLLMKSIDSKWFFYFCLNV
ncbi:MAG: hypothetical protein NZM35_09205 [Chitinophagales bacterium]|nr:hypothetical protein [Chitinophagales bacterium]